VKADTKPPKFFKNELNLNCGNIPNFPSAAKNNNAWNTLKEITVYDLVLNNDRSITECVN